MPWTTSNPPKAISNKSPDAIKVGVAAANSCYERGMSDEECIFAAIVAVKNYESKHSVKKSIIKKQDLPLHLTAVLNLKDNSSIQDTVQPVATNKIRQEFLGKNALVADSNRSLVNVEWDKQGRLVLTFDDGQRIVTTPAPISENVEQHIGVTLKNPFEGTLANFVFVSSLFDLPEPINQVITLKDQFTYYFTTVVDLEGNRLVAGVDTVLLGSSSENCRIKSTGLVGTALITSNQSLPIRGLTIEADIAVDLDGDGTTTALDWFGVNFTNCNQVGRIADYTNFIMTDCALLNSANLVLDGTVGTIGFNSSIFVGRAGQTTITIASTATISRRFRIIYSAFNTPLTGTSLSVSELATIPVEGYILDTVNHSGDGIATVGVPYSNNKAFFTKCRGIPNSAEIANYYMTANADITIINAVSIPVKISGSTLANEITQKFSITNNRATYTGALIRKFKISATASVTSNQQNLQIGFYVAKNAVVLPESEVYTTTNVNNRAENVGIQCILQLETSDYIEIFVENSTNDTDVTITFLNVIVEALN